MAIHINFFCALDVKQLLCISSVCQKLTAVPMITRVQGDTYRRQNPLGLTHKARKSNSCSAPNCSAERISDRGDVV